MTCFKRAEIVALALLAVVVASAGCAKQKGAVEDGTSTRTFFTEITEPPSYDLFAKSLEYYEKKSGLEFRRNAKGKYFLYSAFAWNHFMVADAANNCIFDVSFDRLRSFQSLDSGFATLLDLKVERGPCGISTGNIDAAALDMVQHTEGAVVSRRLRENLEKSVNFISDRRFIQDTLQVPWEVTSNTQGLEPYLAELLERVEDPAQVAFGDIVVFSEYEGEHTIGLYLGYGLLACNCCFRTEIRKLDTRLEYHVYRLYSGFAQVDYRIHQDSVLHDYLANPR